MTDRNTIQYEIATGRATLPVAIVLSLVLWLLTFREWTDFFSLLAGYGIAYLLIELNTTFALIRTRTSLPSAFFLFFFSTAPYLHTYSAEIWIPLLFMGMIFSLSKSFESGQSSTTIFHAFLCTGIASMITPFLLYMVPLIFICMVILRSLSLRTFFAGIIGLLLPYWLLAGYHIYQGSLYECLSPFILIAHFQPIQYQVICFEQLIYWGIIFLLSIVCIFQSLNYAYRDKVQTRVVLQVLATLETGITVLLILQPQLFGVLFPVQMIIGAVMCGYYFALVYNKFSYYFSRVTFGLWLLGSLLNLWMHLFNS